MGTKQACSRGCGKRRHGRDKGVEVASDRAADDQHEQTDKGAAADRIERYQRAVQECQQQGQHPGDHMRGHPAGERSQGERDPRRAAQEIGEVDDDQNRGDDPEGEPYPLDGRSRACTSDIGRAASGSA